MANEVKIKVTTVNDSTRGFKAVDDDLKKIGATASATAAGLDDVAKTASAGFKGVETAAGKASEEMSDFGRKSKEIERDIASLDKTIDQGKRSLRELASAFAQAGSEADRIDISKAMAKINRDISAAGKSKKIKLSEMLDLDPGETPGKFMSFFSKGASAAASSAGPVVGGILGAAMAPTVGGLLAAAVVGGAGIGGLVGGVTLAAKHQGVKTAAKDIGDAIGGDLKSRASVFVEPVIKALGTVKAGYASMSGDISRLFSSTSKFLQPLTEDLVDFGRSLVHGLSEAAQKSGPVVGALGDLMKNTGQSIGQMFIDFSDHAPEAASAVKDLDSAVQNAIKTFTTVGTALAEAKGWQDSLDDSIDKARYSLEDQVGWLDLTADGYKKGSAEAEAYRRKNLGVATAADEALLSGESMIDTTTELADTMDAAAQAAAGETGALEDLSKELKAQTDPVFGLIKAQDDMAAAQKEASDAVKKHGKNSEEAREAYRKQALAAIDLEGQVGKLGKTFDGRMTPALRATLKAAGLTEDAINGLERDFRDAKKSGDAFAKNYKARTTVENAAAARRALYGVRDAANDIPRAVDIAMRITGVTNVSKAADAIRKQYAHGGITGAAAQGGLRDDAMTWVGENGPELLKLPPSTMVMSNADSRRYAGGGPSSGRGSDGPLEVLLKFDPSGAPRLVAGLMETLRAEIGRDGGDVQIALGR